MAAPLLANVSASLLPLSPATRFFKEGQRERLNGFPPQLKFAYPFDFHVAILAQVIKLLDVLQIHQSRPIGLTPPAGNPFLHPPGHDVDHVVVVGVYLELHYPSHFGHPDRLNRRLDRSRLICGIVTTWGRQIPAMRMSRLLGY